MTLEINDRLRNRVIAFFNNVTVNLRYDSIGSTFSLSYYFDPDNTEHKEFSCIAHFHLCTLKHNDEVLLTGVILSIDFTDGAEIKLVHIGGYSLPGVLEDCEIPTSVYPLQSNLVSLREIAKKYIAPFGIKMVVDSSVSTLMDQKYDQTEAKESQSVKSYLSELASQKNIILTHDELGRLVFTKASSKQQPLFDFGTDIPVTAMRLTYNGQGMHSKITVMSQPSEDSEDQASESSVDNPFCPIVFRPKVATQSSGNGTDTLQAAKNMLASELRGISLTLELDRWILNGKIIRPGKIVTVVNPRIYLFNKAKFLIEEVALTMDGSKEVATLKCVVPEVYTGETPVYIWKGINLH